MKPYQKDLAIKRKQKISIGLFLPKLLLFLLLLCCIYCFIYALDVVMNGANTAFPIFVKISPLTEEKSEFLILSILLLSGLFYAICCAGIRFYMVGKLTESIDNKKNAVFPGVKKSIKATALYTCLFFIKFGYFLLFFLPILGNILIFFTLFRETGVTKLSAVFSMCLLISSVVLSNAAYLYATQKFKISDMLLWMNPLMPINSVIQNSVKLSKGKLSVMTFKTVKLYSIGLMCIFIFPAFYLLPKIRSERTKMYLDIIQSKT